MNIRIFTPQDYPAMVDIHNSQNIVWSERPHTPEAWAETDHNRGIGLAMQLRGIAYTREHGYPKLKTCTAALNVPMQALFNKLGYARDPEWQQCQNDIRE
jgi:hypothetical protein